MYLRHGCGCVFQVAVLALLMRCLYRAIYVCFSKSISWKSMRAVDEKQDIKMVWPYHT
jgi:hypothetical protein